ncbi:uncharacterized protein OCT59_011307 [Rhizophagus irregularis]|uniref:Galactose oxidase n=2 Tax=Rhizophagus irregularis TaxID=588596 RepID=U9SZF2_RHIID|nr:hypothetical protein GLOIN_2v1481969 [Rhizophagus irregularis DAOM 181602=DAOM 197198]EXX71349.1 hypothetical protein RirG_079390 [Rhizophagus irregularis DAOM 197198w]POG66916.1 hypothetical protein GLOIN_2v1481969 [Rhizophagus irregularis DAOM 181602=DAOM 197198]UZO20046.1 hypothetical protein OCT59_011307 [Rhizophagus irregularis]|eukprot:XP_025173782.1 hypothetical protein GLOIN_2v1481969 [Rhizophagus irregularis DAOM 181602=DAOM 197198]
MTPYNLKRRGHTATFIYNKLYIFGGSEDGDVGKDFFYIDFSVPFNTQNLIVKDLSNINTIPEHTFVTSVKGGANNNTLFLYGGFGPTSMDLVYTFDPQTNLWNIPKIIGDTYHRKYSLTGIIDDKGKMYLWSGLDIRTNVYSDMLILDTVNLVWGKGSFASIRSMSYAATLLPDNNIIYMDLLDLQVYIYDTINDNWNIKSTSGTISSYRNGFTAVLGLDGQRVIIYGGYRDVTKPPKPVDSPLYELELINFEWRIPKTSGQTLAFRYGHAANVIDKYMVISFGDGYNRSIENDILLLDISNVTEYIWTNEFNSLPPPSNNEPSSINKSLIIGVIGVIIGTWVGFLSLVIFIEYRRYKNRSKDDDNDQVENKVHNYGQEIVQPFKNENIFNHGQEIVELPNNDHIFNHGQEIVELTNNDHIFNHRKEIVQPHIPEPVINNNYNHEQESTQIANDKKLSLQYVQKLEQELQDLKQMILQNNNQSTKN